MPIFNIERPDGSVVSVETPEGATAEDALRFVASTWQPKAEPSTEKAGFSFGDIATSFGQGAVGSVKSISDVAGADNALSQKLGEAGKELQTKFTSGRQAELARQAERMKAAEESGSTWEEIKAGVKNVAEAPLQSIAQGLGSFVPYVPAIIAGPAAAAMGLSARAVAAANVVAKAYAPVVGSAQGAGAVKGAIFDAVYQAEIESKTPEDEARQKAIAAQDYAGKNLDQIALGGGLGYIASKGGAERFLTKEAREKTAAKLLPRVGMAAGEEFVTEGLQGGQEQLAENLALQREGRDVPTFKGVAGKAIQEGLIGALTAGGIGAVSGPSPVAPPPEVAPEAPAQRPSLDAMFKPFGDIDKTELPANLNQMVEEYRDQAGMPDVNAYSVEDIQDALQSRVPDVSNQLLDDVLVAKSGYDGQAQYTPQSILDEARSKNIETDNQGFKDFLNRVAGTEDIQSMSQPQMHVVSTALKNAPEFPAPMTLPEGTNAVRFTNQQYQDVIDSLQAEAKSPDTPAFKQSEIVSKIQELIKSPPIPKAEAADVTAPISPVVGTSDVTSLQPIGTAGAERVEGTEPGRLAIAGPAITEPVRREGAAPRPLDERRVAQSIFNQAVQESDFDVIGDVQTEPTYVPRKVSKDLPEGFSIHSGTFTEAPAGYEIRAGKQLLSTFATEAEAKARASKIAELRKAEAINIEKQIAKLQAPIAVSQNNLDRMEALGQLASPEYAQALDTHKALVQSTDTQVKPLQDQVNLFKYKPITLTPVAATPVTTKGYTVFENGVPSASFSNKAQAEEHVFTKLPSEKLQEIATPVLDRAEKPESRFKQKAQRELDIRAGTVQRETKAPPTKEQALAKLEQIKKLLEPMMAKFNLQGVELAVVNSIANDAEGSYTNKLIQVAIDADNPVRVMRHEVVHALKELGFFTPQQWQALVNQAKSKWVDTYLKNKTAVIDKQTMSRYDAYVNVVKLTEDEIIEEAIADAFADFDVNKAPPGMLSVLLKRLQDFFAALKNAFSGAGFQTAESVFGKIERGQLKENKPAAEPKEAFSLRLDRNKGKFTDADKTISTRKPKSVNAPENYLTDKLNVGVGVVKEDAVLLKKHADLVRNDPMMGTFKSDSDEETINHFIDALKDNLLHLWNTTPKEIRNRSRNWYKGANRIANNLSKEASISENAASGVLAALSPQTPWDTNVSQAARVITIWKNHQNTVADEAMRNWFDEKIAALDKKKTPSEAMVALRDAIQDKSFSQTHPDIQPWWLRAYDETHHSREYHLVAPEGESAGLMLKKDGQPANMPWGNTENIYKALSILNDDSISNISDQMGNAHKVRSFYNNIVDPDSKDEHVTIDTHAVAAARIEPLAGGDPEVLQAWGGKGSSDIQGQGGLYGEYAEAYRRAAQELDVLPREVQSVTWEKIRGFFPDTFKTERTKNHVQSIWEQYRQGNISIKQVKQQITEYSPNENPNWHGVSKPSLKEVKSTPHEVEPASGAVRGRPATEGVDRGVLKYSLRQQVLNMPNGAAILQRVEDTTTAREVKGHVERMIDAITPKSFSRAKLLHRYNRIGENAKRRAQKLGEQELLADVSAEAAALMSDLSSGIVAEALGMNDKIGGIPVYANGFFKVSNMNGTVKGPVAIFAELAKRNDPQIYQLYQYWSGVKRGSRFMANGTEKLFEPADIARAAALEKQFPEFVTVQKEWIAYNNGLVKLMVDTGVITPAAGKEFMKYGDYIPFYRQLEGERTVGPNIFQSIGNVKQPKKQKGESDLPLADFLETVVRNSQAAVETSMKNIAAQRAIRDSLLFQEAEKLPYKATGNNIVTVQENGLTSYYRVQDAALIEAMKGLNLPEIPMMGFIAGPANLLRNLVTKDPGFMMANLLRDSMAAYITSGTNMKPVIDTMHQFGKALAGTSPEVEALRKSGVLGGFDLSGSVDQSAEALSKKLRKNTNTLSAFEKGTSPVTGIWDALEKGSAASDAATRAAVYKRVMEETGNEAEALFKALEVMNFNRRGNSPIIRILTAAIPFLNARMQGMDLLYRATTGQMNMANAKQIQKTFFIRAGTMMGLSLMYYSLVSDDDEFKKQEQEVKDNNWLVPALGIRIPIPHEIGIVFKVIPERIYSLMFKSDTEKDFMNSMIRQLTTTLMVSPPQSVLPLMEMATNYSFFTGRNIVPSTIKDVEAKYQTLTNTSTLAKTIGESLGMSPVKIDHLWKGYTGTMGTYLVDVVDSVLNLHADVPKASKRFEQMPVIKRFALDPDATGKISAYYELKDSTDEVIRTINFLEKNQKFSEMAEYQKDHLNILATEDYVKEIAKTYKELDEFRAFVVSSKMDADAKRDALLNISKMKSNMVSNVQELKKRMSQYGS